MVYKNIFKNTVNCCTPLLKYHGFCPIERFSNVVSDCVQNTGVNLRSQKKGPDIPSCTKGTLHDSHCII
jgi:hypothetical protein